MTKVISYSTIELTSFKRNEKDLRELNKEGFMQKSEIKVPKEDLKSDKPQKSNRLADDSSNIVCNENEDYIERTKEGGILSGKTEFSTPNQQVITDA